MDSCLLLPLRRGLALLPYPTLRVGFCVSLALLRASSYTPSARLYDILRAPIAIASQVSGISQLRGSDVCGTTFVNEAAAITMAIALHTRLSQEVEKAAREAGLQVIEGIESAGFNGVPTEKFTFMLTGAAEARDVQIEKTAAELAGKRQTLELSAGFELQHHQFAKPVHDFLLEAAKRLRNPNPDLYVTLGGLPVTMSGWQWPFHLSTSGADTYIVHGETKLEDGKTPSEAQLRAKVSASMTVTFAEVVPAPEQPFAEGFIYNAVRKILDQGQIELVKSGNRQPVPVTTRYYSAKQQRFIFNDTDEEQRATFIAAKVYWASGVLGGGAPVWIADPRDAQYLNTSVAELKRTAEELAAEGVLSLEPDFEFAASTEPLISHHGEYEARMAEALAFTRPTFNEEMRGGHTNM